MGGPGSGRKKNSGSNPGIFKNKPKTSGKVKPRVANAIGSMKKVVKEKQDFKNSLLKKNRRKDPRTGKPISKKDQEHWNENMRRKGSGI